MDPQPEQRPGFLADFNPDLIARGYGEQIYRVRLIHSTTESNTRTPAQLSLFSVTN